MADQLAIQYRPIDTLTPYAKNPRDHSPAQIAALAASMREWGWTNPVLLDGEGGIIAGHGRVLAAREVGIADIPCIVLGHLSDAQRRALVIADNRLAEFGSTWNADLLTAELGDLRSLAFDTALTGFTAADLTAITAQPADARKTSGNLAERFGVPPFSVLSARDGWWQNRKRAWLALGIRSEIGRGENLQGLSPAANEEYRRREGRFAPATSYQSQSSLNAIMGQRKASPGGSPRRPAADYAKSHARGTGSGRAIPGGGGNAPSAAWMKGSQRAPPTNLTFARGARDMATIDPTSAAILAVAQTGTSIFDPVLCELAYRWFCPPGGAILDPFAGGSVRGVVAAWLGRSYTGIDLSERQIAANREQWEAIREGRQPPSQDVITDDPEALTPIDLVGDVMVKRDDLFAYAGVPGGKVRTCLALATRAIAGGAKGLVTAGSRASPQVNIVAHIGAALGVPVRCHTPKGELSPEVEAARASGAEIIQHTAGYNNVIMARAREDAAARGWGEIPFGMETTEAVTQTRKQVANLPEAVSRIVVPIGSGMSAAGILHGLDDIGRTNVAVLGVVVGADPAARLDKYAPTDWRTRLTLVPSGTDYHAPAAETIFGHIILDPHYEAKCLAYLEPGDLLWTVGVRATERAEAIPGAQPAGVSPARLGPLPVPTVRWRVGAKTMTARHDCTLAGITARCGGNCCKGTTYWPSRSYGDRCGNLGEAGCRLSPGDKPVTCLLYPLVAHPDKGSIVLHHRTRLATSCCKGNYGQGPMLIDAIAENLTQLFGPEQYARVRADVIGGRDSHFEPTPAIAAAIAAEHVMAEANTQPPLRSAMPAAIDSPKDIVARPDPEWIVGDSRAIGTLLPPGALFDMIWTCPPYGDLEVYSDDPRDLSTMDHPGFAAGMRAVLIDAAARLRPDRFAAIVIGEARDPKGMLRGLTPLIITAAEDAGLRFYNEAILVTTAGSLPIRASKQFAGSRKLGRTHQTVLIFVKGDPVRATAAIGPVEMGDMAPGATA